MEMLNGILKLSRIGLFVIIATGLKAQCNLTATSTHTNANCYGDSGTITVTASGGTGSYTYSQNSGVTIGPETFDNSSSLTTANGLADTTAWNSPSTCAEGGIKWFATGGCSGGSGSGVVGYTSTPGQYLGCFLRSPAVHCSGLNHVTLTFDLTNSASTLGDSIYFYIWSNISSTFYPSCEGVGCPASVVSSINGLAASHILMDSARSCKLMTVDFDLTSIPMADRASLLFYINPYFLEDTIVPFNVLFDNITISGNVPEASNTFQVPAGIYSVEVQDSLGCTASVTDTIRQPSQITINIIQTEHGSCADTATAIVSGGTPPYIVEWSDVANQVGLSETHVCADSLYYVNVTDSGGCIAIDSVTGGGLAVVINTTPSVNCYGLICNGTANAQVTGGNPPYTYKWSNGQTTDGIANLCIGTGSLTVKDAIGDSVVKAFTIDTTPQISINVTTQPNSGCSGVCNGTVSVTFINKGDGGPYKFKWSDEVPLTSTGSRTGLCAGSYTVSAIDLGPCYSDTVVANFTINQASSLSETLTTYSSCNGTNSGSIIANVINGTGGLLYSINPGQPIATETFDNRSSLVTVDSSVYSSWFSPGTCTGGGMTWQSTGGCSGGSGSGAVGYTSSPGPSNGCFLRSPLINCTNHTLINIGFDLTNTASPFSDSIKFYVWSDVTNAYYATLMTFVNGVSTSKIALATGRTCDSMNVIFDIATIPLADRAALYFYLQPTFQEASGYSFNLLLDNISISDTTPLYLWQPGNTFTNLSPGAYTVSVMDTSGCFASVTDTVGSGGSYTVAATSNSPVCIGDTIHLNANVSSGTATYAWSGPNGPVTSSPANVPDAQLYDGGTYTVSAVNDSGCLATNSVNVVIDEIQDSVSAISATCDGICNGEAKVALVWQGVGPFTYSWNGAGYNSDPNDSNICAGEYHVIISDSLGCIKSDSVTIVNLSNSCDVWPGDANDDGVVNNNDILEIGLGYGYTGPVRNSASLVWIGQPALDWDSVLPPGVNAKFADCDGNGIINADDTMAVTLNYSLTHPKNGGPQGNNGPLLYIQLPPQDSAEAGQPVQVPVYLGTQGDPVTVIAGVAFSINYNNSLVDSTVQLSASGSWMGTPGVNLLTFRENLYNAGVTDIALTRTDHTDVTGYGPLCTLTYVMKDDISGKSEISKILPFTISGVTAITSKGVIVPLSFGASDTVIAYQYTGISNISLSNSLRVYPNPAGQYIIADAGKVIVDQYIITDLLGSELKIIDAKQQGPMSIDVSRLAAGMYFLQARSGDELTTLKFSVIR